MSLLPTATIQAPSPDSASFNLCTYTHLQHLGVFGVWTSSSFVQEADMQLMAACTARCRRPWIVPFQVYQPQLVVSRLHSCYRSTDAITGRPTRMDIHHGPDDAHRCCYILSSRCVCSQHDIYSRWQLRVAAIDPARITGRARDRSMLWMPMTTRPASASTSH